jgi:hypothetical protein
MADLTYISVENAHKRAVGLKIRNILFSEAWQRNIFSTDLTNYSIKKDQKYQGAHVIKPRQTGVIGPKLSIQERCQKYLMSLSLDELTALYRARIIDAIGGDDIDAETRGKTLAELREVIESYDITEDEIINQVFAALINSILSGTQHKQWLNLESLDDYKGFAEMSEIEMRYWRKQIDNYGSTLSESELETVSRELSDKE